MNWLTFASRTVGYRCDWAAGGTSGPGPAARLGHDRLIDRFVASSHEVHGESLLDVASTSRRGDRLQSIDSADCLLERIDYEPRFAVPNDLRQGPAPRRYQGRATCLSLGRHQAKRLGPMNQQKHAGGFPVDRRELRLRQEAEILDLPAVDMWLDSLVEIRLVYQ